MRHKHGQEMKESLLDAGLNTATSELEDLGPWLTEFPELSRIDLKTYQGQALHSADAVKNTTQSLKPIDLQPINMTSDALIGKAATGRFALSNPNHTQSTGTLIIDGKVANIDWDDLTNTYSTLELRLELEI